jgi:hypothetical protein
MVVQFQPIDFFSDFNRIFEVQSFAGIGGMAEFEK